MEAFYIRELDLEDYINFFVTEFCKCYPGIYTEEKLKDILHETVSKISLYEQLSENVSGVYDSANKEIKLLRDEKSYVVFHEFIHAIRAYYSPFTKNMLGYDDETNMVKKVNLADEGMTEYLTVLYSARKKFNVTNIEHVVFNKNIKLSSYAYSAAFHSMLSTLIKMVFEGANIIERYFKGENVYTYLYKLVYKYLTDLGGVNEDNDMLALRICNIFLTYLADLGESHKLLDNDINTMSEYKFLETLLKNMLYTVKYGVNQDNIENSHLIEKSFLCETPIPAEEKLFAAIMGEGLNLYTYEDINELVENFIISADQR